MRINPPLLLFCFRITNHGSPFKDFPHTSSKFNLGHIQTFRDVKGFHLYCSVHMESLLKGSNYFCGTKKCILVVTVVLWGGQAGVGKESLIEQTNE